MLRHQSINIYTNQNNFERDPSPTNNGDILMNLNKYNLGNNNSMRSLSVPKRFDENFRRKSSIQLGNPEYLQSHLIDLWDKNRKLIRAYHNEIKKFSKTPSK